MSHQDGEERFYHLALALILGCLLLTALVAVGALWWAFDVLIRDFAPAYSLEGYP